MQRARLRSRPAEVRERVQRAAVRQVDGLVAGARDLVYRTPLWELSLRSTPPEDVAVVVTDPWPGDQERGTAIAEGSLPFAGQNFYWQAGNWTPVGAHAGWLAELHGFTWLRDLRALGEAGRGRARELVVDWIQTQSRWHSVGWRGDVAGARLAAWLGHLDWLMDGLPQEYRRSMLQASAKQARHLMRAWRTAPAGSLRFTALKGLAHALFCLIPEPRRHHRYYKALAAEIENQVHADGGHVERSPSAHLQALRDLIEIRRVLVAARAEVWGDLQSAIDRMAPFLRFIRHGDGGLALFNDSNEDDPSWIDTVLAQSDAKGKPPTGAPHTGFQRLLANKTLVIADTGAPGLLDGHAHAGTLSFEMSVGKERLIVNCGAHPADLSDWRRVQRATAAHSTLTIDDTNSAEILGPAGPIAGSMGYRPRAVACRRDESEGNQWLDLSHDGFAALYGVVHRRRLYLEASGDDLRGEDTLVGPGQGHFAIRFHLHPRVQASLLQDGSAALLRLPGGAGWRLRASGGQLALADSIYLGKRGEMKRSQQVVISGPVQPREDTVVKWALRREGQPR